MAKTRKSQGLSITFVSETLKLTGRSNLTWLYLRKYAFQVIVSRKLRLDLVLIEKHIEFKKKKMQQMSECKKLLCCRDRHGANSLQQKKQKKTEGKMT